MRKITEIKNPANNVTMTGNTCKCTKCVLPHSYAFGEMEQDGECKYCKTFIPKTFKNETELIKDLDLQPGERLGITVSGGKDSIYMWGVLADLLGADRITAFCFYRPGISSPVALENVKKTKEIFGSDLYIIEDPEAQNRFRRNMEILMQKTDPAAVRVLLCSGCRYGITGQLYEKGESMGIRKYISGASYLELAPFKEELLAAKSVYNDLDEGFDNLIAGYPELNYGNNLEIICRDQKYKYKDNTSLHNRIPQVAGRKLFDFDDYFENKPENIEALVKERFDWKKTDRSWHFDCIVEDFKDMFYYGMLGYTELDFKYSAMTRYQLLTRDEALEKIQEEERKLADSYDKMERLFIEHGLSHLIGQLQQFYQNSPYLIYHPQKQQKINMPGHQIA